MSGSARIGPIGWRVAAVDARHRGQEHELLPQLDVDVLGKRDVEAGLTRGCDERRQGRIGATVGVAEAEQGELAGMDDGAGRSDDGRDLRIAADDVVGAEDRRHAFHRVDAVLHGDDAGGARNKRAQAAAACSGPTA